MNRKSLRIILSINDIRINQIIIIFFKMVIYKFKEILQSQLLKNRNLTFISFHILHFKISIIQCA